MSFRQMTADAIPPDLPIAAAIPEILAALTERTNLVLEAAPGAGKTTAVPLALLDAAWCCDRRIVMLEPRRLATRAAARRMASMLGEEVGERVGYRVRLDRRVGPATRIEIVTDGIFSRMIQDDPELIGIAAVLFDEFHERRAETDLGLALALDAQAAFRPDLRLLVMSATLDGIATASLLGAARHIVVPGRGFPVERRYLAAPRPGGLIPALVDAVARALAEPGDILVFLPGGREIRQLQRRLRDLALPAETDILPLFGELDQAAQDRAIAPSVPGRRKLVLATSIAETSLTIAGVTQVVDAGLARQSRYDPRTGLSRLETVPVTQAAAEQRAGRAGRTAPGICWRLWAEAAHAGLRPHAPAEMSLADPTGLLLSLAAWGIDDPTQLKLLDPPPGANMTAARRLLLTIEALDPTGRITDHGRAIARFGLPPRLAHLVLLAHGAGDGPLGCALAALLADGEDGGVRDADLRGRLERFERDSAFGQTRAVARAAARRLGVGWQRPDAAAAGRYLAAAFPERVARRRADSGVEAGTVRYQLAGGIGAVLPDSDPVARHDWIVALELDGQTPDARIWLAYPLSEADRAAVVTRDARWEPQIVYDRASRSVLARERRLLGTLALGERPLTAADPALIAAALLRGVREEGIEALGWSPAAQHLRSRVRFLASLDGADAGWPDWTDAGLAATLDAWLAPAIEGRTSLAELERLDFTRILGSQLRRAQSADLDRRAPSHYTAPTGSRLAIDYDDPTRPAVSVRLQELFGLAEHPAVGAGRVPLVLHLLSPAQRPIQVTRDLARFWQGSYRAVRADLRGRYPKHSWPEDPLAALPTTRAKPRQ